MDFEKDKKVEGMARELVRVERQCFYGDEPERDRLRKMRELVDKYEKELKE